MRQSRRILLDSALVSGLFLVVASWFTTALLRPRAVALLGLVMVLGLLVSNRRAVAAFRPLISIPVIWMVLVCGLGVALRAPAFMEPAGFVGADGSLQAILVNVILNRERPAPVLLETSSFPRGTSTRSATKAPISIRPTPMLPTGWLGASVNWV